MGGPGQGKQFMKATVAAELGLGDIAQVSTDFAGSMSNAYVTVPSHLPHNIGAGLSWAQKVLGLVCVTV